MRFVTTSKIPLIRSAMAFSFLEDAIKRKKVYEIVNLDEVLSLINPKYISDHYFESLRIIGEQYEESK